MRHHAPRVRLLFGVSLLLLLVAVAGALRLWGVSVAVRVVSSRALSVEPPTEFWVHDGTLVAVWIDGWRVSIEAWTDLQHTPRQIIDVEALMSRAPNESPKPSSRDGLPVQKRRAGQPMPNLQAQVARPPAAVRQSAVPPPSRVVPPKAPKDVVAPRIAVSPDVSTIAWVWNDGVHLLRRASPATVKDPLGPFLTALSPGSELLVADTGRAPAVRSWPKPLPPGTLSYALSPAGRLAVGTRQGTVEWLDLAPDVPDTTQPMDAPGAVRALAFHEESGVVVGGDFRGLHLLTPGSASVEVVASVVGTRALASWGPRLVYLTDEGLTAATLGDTLRLTAAGIVVLALGGLAVVGFVGVNLARPRRAARRLVESAIGPSAAPPAPLPEIRAEHWAVPSPPEKLVAACRRGECVLYAGAGLSAQAGLPTWRPFLEGLLGRANKAGLLESGFAASMRAALDQGLTDPVADGLMNVFKAKPDLFLEHLRSVFLVPNATLPPALRLLRDLPVSAAITTNFDDLLERTYRRLVQRVLTPKDPEALLESLSKRAFFLLKLYGTLERPETLVAAPAAFSEMVAKNLPFSSVMEGLFVSRTLLFLGVSLEGIDTYLSGLSLKDHLTRPHYALVDVAGTVWQARASVLQRRYGIEVLPCSPTPGHPELGAFLAALVKTVRAGTEQEAQAGARLTEQAGAARPLRRLQLHNIGPFTHFALELTPGWTVLLGDNGVGKSNILRAIALGVCGRDAEPYAARSIKSGETSATVVLETEDSTYRTEIRRLDSGSASVSVVPARPLDLEGWLALGFPPLRSVSWDRPKGPTGEAAGARGDAVPDDPVVLSVRGPQAGHREGARQD